MRFKVVSPKGKPTLKVLNSNPNVETGVNNHIKIIIRSREKFDRADAVNEGLILID